MIEVDRLTSTTRMKLCIEIAYPAANSAYSFRNSAKKIKCTAKDSATYLTEPVNPPISIGLSDLTVAERRRAELISHRSRFDRHAPRDCRVRGPTLLRRG